MNFDSRFSGKTAIVTGGASGIGLAVAERLLAEGARVSVWDASEANLIDLRARLPQIHTCAVDVTLPEQVALAMQNTLATTGGNLDVLVTSAGITGPNVPLAEYPTDEWKRVIDVNLNGVFYSNRAAVPVMLKNNYGRIVNIASIAGKEGNPNASAYSASKAGVIGLTKSLGKELARTGICVNCVTPAAVETAIFGQMSPAFIEFMLSKIPMGRFGRTEEVSALICWLASSECSFSTGSVFDISGGRATY